MVKEGVEESFVSASQDFSMVNNVAGADEEISDVVVDSKSKDQKQAESYAEDGKKADDVAGADEEAPGMVEDSKSRDQKQAELSAEDGKSVNYSFDNAGDEKDSSEPAPSNDSKLQWWSIDALSCKSGGKSKGFFKEKRVHLWMICVKTKG
eukprot:10920977-Ditylum_brightwellii.AAC.1